MSFERLMMNETEMETGSGYIIDFKAIEKLGDLSFQQSADGLDIVPLDLRKEYQLSKVPQLGPSKAGDHVAQRHNNKLGYLVYLPKKYTGEEGPNKLWPVVLFLHGAGESGPPDDPRKIISLGLAGCPNNQPAAMGDRFIVISPHTSEGWSSRGIQRRVKEMLEDVLKTVKADKTRIYLTGVSMGGNGAWSFATNFPNYFAAVAPVCGFGSEEVAENIEAGALKNTPVWNFHGANDVVVPCSASDSIVALAKENNVDVKYTRYERSPPPPGYASYDGHASWMQAYSEKALWDWFLTKSKDIAT